MREPGVRQYAKPNCLRPPTGHGFDSYDTWQILYKSRYLLSDGLRIISGSDDDTIQVLDAYPNVAVGKPLVVALHDMCVVCG